jgi:hypothetical protein
VAECVPELLTAGIGGLWDLVAGHARHAQEMGYAGLAGRFAVLSARLESQRPAASA